MLDYKHPFFKTFSALIKETTQNTPVYDLGTNRRFAKEVGLLRHLFDERNYIAGSYEIDFSYGPDNCDICCDIQDMKDIPNNTVGSVICLSVLEHVVYPRKALSEIFRILKPGGISIVSVPFFFPYHGKTQFLANPSYLKHDDISFKSGHSTYGDFWRMSHEGLVVLFHEAGFSRVDVYPIEGRIISRLKILGVYPLFSSIPFINSIIKYFDNPKLGGMTTMHFVRAQK